MKVVAILIILTHIAFGCVSDNEKELVKVDVKYKGNLIGIDSPEILGILSDAQIEHGFFMFKGQNKGVFQYSDGTLDSIWF